MKRSTLLGAALIVIAGLFAYRSSFSGVFVFDDIPSVARNPNIRSLSPLSRALSAPTEVTVAGRPIVSLSLALNHALASSDVRDVFEAPGPGAPPDAADRYARNLWGYHAFNLAVHVLAGLALFGIVRRTLGEIPANLKVRRSKDRRSKDRKATLRSGEPSGSPSSTSLALIVALLWVVHPLLTGSVTYIVQRAESLMGLFFLLTLYCAIRAHERAHRTWWMAASIFACALGMGSKEAMITAPILVWLWDRVFGDRLSPREPIAARVPLYAGLAVTWLILGGIMLAFPRSHSIGFQFAEWPWWRYLITQAAVVVHYLRLAVIPKGLALDYGWPPWSAAQAAAPAALLLTLIGGAAWALWRRRAEGFAGAWFFLILAPTSSLIPISTEIAAEHRMYLPLAAVIALLVVAGHRLLRRVPGRAGVVTGAVVCAGLILLFAVQTDARNLDYSSESRIWADTVEKRPDNARAHANYGAALQTARRFSEAEQQLRIADRLRPNEPDTEASLGVALASQGRFPEALDYLERSAAARDDDAAIQQNLAEAYAASGRLALALTHFLRAIDLRPDDPFLLNRAGWILATGRDDQLRDGARAAELAARAVQITGRRDVVSLDTLAASEAELGRFDAATLAAREAVALAHTLGDEAMVPELDQRLRMYEARQKFRQ